MKWSLQMGRVAGIGLYLHATFPLLLIWIGARQYSVRHDWRDAAAGVLMICILFAIVVLHELGHALTARRCGIGTRDITLLPIGGVARLERIPEDPKQEMLVALAGPAVNVCLAGFFFALLGAGNQFAEVSQTGFLVNQLLPALMWINIVLAGFNLLPVFPMDGGRVLRALLAMRLSYVRATRIAATIGQGMALVFASFGLSALVFGTQGFFSNPFLLVLAVFVWVAAGQEAALVQLRGVLGDATVTQMMRTEFRSLAPQQPLVHAVEYLLAGWQHDFPVLENGFPVGLATRRRLLDALAEHGYAGTVTDAMVREFATIEASEKADAALTRLHAASLGTILVLRQGRMAGMLTHDSVREYLAIRGALRREEAQAWAGAQREAA